MKWFVILLLGFSSAIAVAQEKLSVEKGTIFFTTNQSYAFTKLRSADDQVTFLNTATQSEFTYFKNSIRNIKDADGNLIFGSEPPKVNAVKPVEWLNRNYTSTDYVRAEIVTRNKDTLRVKVKVSTSTFIGEVVDERSFHNIIKLTEDGKTVQKIVARDINVMRFYDFMGSLREFINNGDYLAELLYDGKIKWLRHYSTNLSMNKEFVDSMTNEKGERISVNYLLNVRKSLKTITNSRPELTKMIDEMKITDDNIGKLLRKYDKLN
ncbi:MAG: hypothetical protein EOO50_04780 [Flavobacterium sp.]|uniref:hypothetical protein n=1 Tax=Flavobacterium sp. TaxID=239 RepID=UPI0012159620|nr:hypothetical protein [Flavobacterium sp.]RZJ67598.1 MAG: hypothetical protein EOO50_04780 [Flavobacterium sp.]